MCDEGRSVILFDQSLLTCLLFPVFGAGKQGGIGIMPEQTLSNSAPDGSQGQEAAKKKIIIKK